MLCHHLNRNLPNFHVQLEYFTDKNEFLAYAVELGMKHEWFSSPPQYELKLKGTDDLNEQTCVVYRESGEYIGSAQEFIDLIKISYGVEHPMDDASLIDISYENSDLDMLTA